MSEIKKQIISLLKITSKVLESLTEEQCNNILSGKGKIIYEDISKNSTISKRENFNFKSYIEKIESFDNREEAYNFIQELSLKKADMVEIAKQLKIHLNKSDKKDVIIKKIIETTVGTKLRNEAIKNINLKENK